MPKMKTHSSSKKRFHITGSGKVSYQKNGRRHGMISKDAKRLRTLKMTGVVENKAIEQRMKTLLPYA